MQKIGNFIVRTVDYIFFGLMVLILISAILSLSQTIFNGWLQYCAIGTILEDELGLPKKEFPVSLDDNDRKWKGKILEDIFRGGNFGKLHHQAHSSWKFKVETMCVALRNSFRYYRLCPSEVGGMIPRLLKGNLKILLAK